MRVFVVDTNKKPLTPCRPKRAKQLLKQGKAAVFRRFPFTIILKYAVENVSPKPLRVKIDPGSKTTGIAIITEKGEIVFAANLEHRGHSIKKSLDSRRAIRRSRRNRKTRYRKPRFLNRTRKKNWISPSLKSRVCNILTWVKRLIKFSSTKAISQELVKFDTQAMGNPEISGIEYQQGELAGYEIREYLLKKWNRTCVYCGKTDVPLEIEHIVAKVNGGTNRISNLTLSCRTCNEKKGTKTIEKFLRKKPEVLSKILKQAKSSLKDATAVNATRWMLYNRLKELELPIEVGSGGLTKYNRIKRNLPKEHWSDAVCVGKSTPEKIHRKDIQPLKIQAVGYGNRQMCLMDKYGFPRTSAKTTKRVNGFQTGDIVKAIVPDGKKTGLYTGRIAIRTNGYFNITTEYGIIQGIHSRFCHRIHLCDGYFYV